MPVHSLPGFFEPYSALTQLAGVAVFGLLGALLVRRGAPDVGRILLLLVFAVSSVAMLSVSAAYHMLADGTGGREVLSRLDGAAIFVLLAGTHTAMHGLHFRGLARFGPLLLMWAATAVAVSVFTVFSGALPGTVVTVVYLTLGWLASASGFAIWRRFGAARIVLPLLGGIAYSVGAILLTLGRPTPIPGVVGAHEVWHLFVLAALALHWAFLFRYAGVDAHAKSPAVGPQYSDRAAWLTANTPQ